MTLVSVFNTHPRYKVQNSVFRKLAQSVFAREGTRTAKCSVIFVDDKRMVDLNSTYLRHHYTTDVLSFPLHDPGEPLDGEVYVNIDQARRQARKFKATYKAELARLVIHGALHLIGYDDSTERNKKRMSHLEDRYLLLLD